MQTHPAQTKLLSSFVLHYDGLVKYIHRYFGNYQFANDVVQDVCIHLMENPISTEIEFPLSYLRKASFNQALDKRKYIKVCEEYAATVEPDSEAHYHDGAAALELKQKIEQFKRIIDNLPQKQRLVFLMHQLHEMPHKEIATEMGISPNMVSRHFNKAMDSITIARKQLGL
nr:MULTISPECIES: sigma-70 family RNA polymerase sigma factor [unclassified Methylophilus]